MSNYLSKPYQMTQPISWSAEIMYAGKVANELQTRYDSNKAAVDQMINQFENLKGVRDTDNEYIAAKLSQVKSLLRGDIRYQHASESAHITKSLMNIVKDPIVRDAIMSKQVIQNFEAEAAKRKEKNDGSYDDRNYLFSREQSGYNEYMNGKSNVLKSMSYIPYVDLKEKHLKELKTIKDLKGKRHIELDGGYNENGVKIVIKKEIDGLTDVEIQNYFSANLSPQDKQQMTINGWSNWSQSEASKLQAKSLLQQTNDAKVKNLEVISKIHETDMKNSNLSDEKKEQARRSYEQISKNIEQLKSYDYSKLNDKEVAYNLEKSAYLTSLSSAAGAEWSKKSEVDTIWKAGQDLEVQRQNMDINRRKLEIAEENLKINKTKAEEEREAKNEVTTYTRTDETLTEEIDAGDDLKEVRNRFNEANKGIQKTAINILSNYTDEQVKPFLNKLTEKGLKYENGKIDFINPEDAKTKPLSALTYLAYKESGVAKISGADAATMKQYDKERNTSVRDIKETEEPGLKTTFEKNPDKYIDDFMDTVYQLEQTQNMDVLRDVVEPIMGKEYVSKNIKEGYNPNYNLIAKDVKNELLKRPDLLSSFDKQAQQLHKRQDGNIFMTQNTKTYSLREDAKGEISNLIKKRTEQGLMTSISTGFKISNPKRKKEILAMIPNMEAATDKFDENGDLEFHFDKDRNLVLYQRKADEDSDKKYSEFIVNPDNKTLYNELSSMVELNKKSNLTNAAKTYTSSTQKVELGTYNNQSRNLNIQAQLAQDANTGNGLISLFGSAELAVKLADKQYAKNVIKNMLVTNKKIDEASADKIVAQITDKANNYTSKITTAYNPSVGNYYFQLNFEDTKEGKTHVEPFMQIQKLSTNAEYLMEEFPEMFLLRRMLKDISDPDNKQIEDIQNVVNKY